ncbi:MAG: hypothetical protein K5644_08890 [Lachnospiraceae bacterium]|nr:hypothetical protein [Lachnospiraceae bacterium]
MYDEYNDTNSMDSNDMWGGYSSDNYGTDNYSNDNYGTDNYASGNANSEDDVLLSQIDAFRDQAKQLQSMINERKIKANQMDAMGGRNGMAASADLSRELDRMAQSINTSISAITTRLNQQDGTLANIESRIGAQDGTLSGIDSRLSAQDGTLNGIEMKLNQQDGTLTSIDSKLSSQEAAPQQEMPEAGELEGKIDEIQLSLNKLNAGTENMQNELSEKIHSENVKVYRNLNDVIKENDKGDETANTLLKKIKGVKTSANLALIFSIFDFAGIGAIVFLMLKMTGIL